MLKWHNTRQMSFRQSLFVLVQNVNICNLYCDMPFHLFKNGFMTLLIFRKSEIHQFSKQNLTASKSSERNMSAYKNNFTHVCYAASVGASSRKKISAIKKKKNI